MTVRRTFVRKFDYKFAIVLQILGVPLETRQANWISAIGYILLHTYIFRTYYVRLLPPSTNSSFRFVCLFLLLLLLAPLGGLRQGCSCNPRRQRQRQQQQRHQLLLLWARPSASRPLRRRRQRQQRQPLLLLLPLCLLPPLPLRTRERAASWPTSPTRCSRSSSSPRAVGRGAAAARLGRRTLELLAEQPQEAARRAAAGGTRA